MGVLAPIQAFPLLLQLSVDVLGKAVEDGSNVWVLVTHVGDLGGVPSS